MPFTIYLPTKVVYDQRVGEALPAELGDRSGRRVLLISDPAVAQLGWAEHIGSSLKAAGCTTTTYTDVSSGPTVAELAAALAIARDQNVEVVIGLGGGSVIDLAKAVALLLRDPDQPVDYLDGGRSVEQRDCLMLAVPTTAGAGGEISRNILLVDTDRSTIRRLSSPLAYPQLALLDPELTISKPPLITAATGLLAFSQALEAYIGRQANPFSDQLAISAMQAVWTFLPRAVNDGHDVAARQAMVLAALWAGIAADQADLGIVHALATTLTAHLRIHQGTVSALILPQALRYNLPSVPATRRQRLNRLFNLPADADGDALLERLNLFITYLRLPTRLTELGIPLNGFDWGALAAEAMRISSVANNPQPASLEACQALLSALEA